MESGSHPGQRQKRKNLPHIVLAGGSGALGHALIPALIEQGYSIVILTRNPQAPQSPQAPQVPQVPQVQQGQVRQVAWDARSPGPWQTELNGAVAVLNLVGQSVDCRPTASNLERLRSSRVDSVKALAQACENCESPPKIWLQASAIAYYGDVPKEICSEERAAGNSPLADLCAAWEASFDEVSIATMRKICLRISVVLGSDFGALPKLASITRLGLGGKVGSGKQWISWLHVDDFVKAIVWMLQNSKAQGIYNLSAPEPVSNQAFQAALRNRLGVRFGLPAPTPAAKLGAWVLGTNSELALASLNCPPTRLQQQEFAFLYPDLHSALKNLLPGSGNTDFSTKSTPAS
jgi:uncharacterized protein